MILEINPGEVLIDGRRMNWPFVEINDNHGQKYKPNHPWPWRGFTVALENGWFVQVNHRHDYDDPEEGTPEACHVVVGPCEWTQFVNNHAIRSAAWKNYEKASDALTLHGLVPVERIRLIIEEAAKRSSPPREVMDAVRGQGFRS